MAASSVKSLASGHRECRYCGRPLSLDQQVEQEEKQSVLERLAELEEKGVLEKLEQLDEVAGLG